MHYLSNNSLVMHEHLFECMFFPRSIYIASDYCLCTRHLKLSLTIGISPSKLQKQTIPLNFEVSSSQNLKTSEKVITWKKYFPSECIYYLFIAIAFCVIALTSYPRSKLTVVVMFICLLWGNFWVTFIQYVMLVLTHCLVETLDHKYIRVNSACTMI